MPFIVSFHEVVYLKLLHFPTFKDSLKFKLSMKSCNPQVLPLISGLKTTILLAKEHESLCYPGHGLRRPNVCDLEPKYRKRVFAAAPAMGIPVHKRDKQLSCNSNKIFINSDLDSSWVAILHPGYSIMLSKVDHLGNQRKRIHRGNTLRPA